jgi:hypothetical protein
MRVAYVAGRKARGTHRPPDGRARFGVHGRPSAAQRRAFELIENITL